MGVVPRARYAYDCVALDWPMIFKLHITKILFVAEVGVIDAESPDTADPPPDVVIIELVVKVDCKIVD
jgi:hypothetical protein